MTREIVKDVAISPLEILKILPHRYPFLLVDKILKVENSRKAVGIKNVTFNEPFFSGHFPGSPIMPGVLIVEAMAQVGGVVVLSIPEWKGKLPYLTGIDKIRFRKPVIPGDQLVMEVGIINMKGNIGKVSAEARVDGQLVAAGEFLFAIVEAANNENMGNVAVKEKEEVAVKEKEDDKEVEI